MNRDSDDGPGVPTGATVARDLVSTATSTEPDDGEASIPSEDFAEARYDFVQSSPSVFTEFSSRERSCVISDLQPVQEEAYGGGLYGKDDDQEVKQSPRRNGSKVIMSPRACDFQSADGPPVSPSSKVRSPRSTGDRDLDITGQAYIQ